MNNLLVRGYDYLKVFKPEHFFSMLFVLYIVIGSQGNKETDQLADGKILL